MQEHLEQDEKEEEARKSWRATQSSWRARAVAGAMGGAAAAAAVAASRTAARMVRGIPSVVNLETARTLLPPHAALYYSRRDHRYRGYYISDGCRPSISAAIQQYGERNSLLFCVQELWRMHESSETNDPCWVTGLMDLTF